MKSIKEIITSKKYQNGRFFGNGIIRKTIGAKRVAIKVSNKNLGRDNYGIAF